MKIVPEPSTNGKHHDSETFVNRIKNLSGQTAPILPDLPGKDGVTTPPVPTPILPHSPKRSIDGIDGIDGLFSGMGGIIGDTARFLAEYIYLPDKSALTITLWVMAARLMEHWDRFPHLAINSPEKRCGKTTLLKLLKLLVPRPLFSTNISPAALYRTIEVKKPTLLLDEAQSLKRRGSEAIESLREIFCASIDRDTATVSRCVGNSHEPKEFDVYCPKILASIGDLDGVLGDRCLTITLMRRGKNDRIVKHYRSREVEPRGKEICSKIEEWATAHKNKVLQDYLAVEPFNIDNDRMAELLMPLQAVANGSGYKLGKQMLQSYAMMIDGQEKELETNSVSVRLLNALREIFNDQKYQTEWKCLSHSTSLKNVCYHKYGNEPWICTATLISELIKREEEPWKTFTNGKDITPEALARLLRPFKVKSGRDNEQISRGYSKSSLKDAWERYLPPAPPENPSTSSTPSTRSSGGGQ